MYEDLERLNTLREKGAITEEEFQKEKKRILDAMDAKAEGAPPTAKRQLWGMDERGFSSMLHISQFAGMIVPLAGYAMPIIMWVVGRDESETVDRHGRNVINWMISFIIYFSISAILTVVGIGLFLMLALAIVNLIFVIKGTIKANDGIFWEYPMTIKIL